MSKYKKILYIFLIIAAALKVYLIIKPEFIPKIVNTKINLCLQLRRDCIGQVEFESGEMKRFYTNLCEKFLDYCRKGCYDE